LSESSLIFSKCKRCGRALRAAKAQSIGYGSICWKKHQAESEEELKKGLTLGEHGQSSLILYIL
jgi:glutaredoxin